MKKFLALLLALMMVLSLAACAKDEAPADDAADAPADAPADDAADAPADAPADGEIALSDELQAIYDKIRFKPVANTTGESLKIVTICVMNNSFWFDVVEGIDDAIKLFADPAFNTEVEMVTIEAHDGQLYAEAIDNCVTMQYDAICTVGTSEAIIPAVDRATEAGIPVYTYNSDVADSTRVAFVGQDLYAAGQVAGQTMADLIGGKGKVAVITGYFTVPAHEERRLGAQSIFDQYPDIEIVAEVEDHDSSDEGYTFTKDFITANPDLAGIIVHAGGQDGVTKALADLNIQGEVKVVCYDFMDEIIDAIYENRIQATIGQDPYAQGMDPVCLAYNHLITGEPEITGGAFTNADVVTPDNVAEMFPR